MRNFAPKAVTTTDIFNGPYAEALEIARQKHKEHENISTVSFTIEGEEDGEGIVKRHDAFGSATPPYQEIVQGPLK